MFSVPSEEKPSKDYYARLIQELTQFRSFLCVCITEGPDTLGRLSREQLRLRAQCKFTDQPTVLECLKDGTLLVGGLDISYAKENDSVAYAALCVFRLDVTNRAPEVNLVDELYCRVSVDVPYINSFLAFREVPAYQTVVSEFLASRPSHLHPHVFMVDGNGTLHPRAFGSACHLGVVLQRPTFGVAKDLAYLPPPPAANINEPGVYIAHTRQKLRALPHGSSLNIVNSDGTVCGVAFQTPTSTHPIFISPGNLITLETAVQITRSCCRYRLPEPTRRADHITRQALERLSTEENSYPL
nr:unnamed protein product [Spirometra erinaceieuropaei]